MKFIKVSFLILLLLVNYELIYGKLVNKRQVDDISVSFDDIMVPEVMKRWYVAYKHKNDYDQSQFPKRRLFPSNLQVKCLFLNTTRLK